MRDFGKGVHDGFLCGVCVSSYSEYVALKSFLSSLTKKKEEKKASNPFSLELVHSVNHCVSTRGTLWPMRLCNSNRILVQILRSHVEWLELSCVIAFVKNIQATVLSIKTVTLLRSLLTFLITHSFSYVHGDTRVRIKQDLNGLPCTADWL